MHGGEGQFLLAYRKARFTLFKICSRPAANDVKNVRDLGKICPLEKGNE